MDERIALCFELPVIEEGDSLPEWLQALPSPDSDGVIRGLDGRSWTLKNPFSIPDFHARRGISIPIDINHSTDLKGPIGEEAPALGQIDHFAVEDGRVRAHVEFWNPRGESALRNRDYRYLSPIILFDGKQADKGLNTLGDIFAITSIAFTNRPNFPLKAMNTAEVNLKREDNKVMNPEHLKALGLPENATPEQINARLEELSKAANTQDKPKDEALTIEKVSGMIEKAINTAVTAAIAPFVKKDAESFEASVEKALNQYTKDGKIAPTEIALNFYKNQCQTEEGFKATCAYLDQAPVIVKTKNTINGSPKAPGAKVPSKILALCGVTQEEFDKAPGYKRPEEIA